ncbi:MAG: hypothetical protein CSB55_05070 [Candidatus Cloacimonadota bacterium]|nr:MAG: hypothetical protein CSB55_05070 [Candidatus Cloacimonadota bacterium]
MIKKNNIYGKIELDNFKRHQKYIKQNNINLEICLTKSQYFYPYKKGNRLFSEIAELPVKKITHLPFFGLDLGCKDSYLMDISKDIVKSAVWASLEYDCFSGVFHTTLNPLLPRKSMLKWFDRFSFSLEEILKTAQENNYTLFLENTYEKDTSLFKKIFERFDADNLKICLDTAHVFCFSNHKNPDFWLSELGEKIGHIHVSDNFGEEDEHLPLGCGSLPYHILIKKLEDLNLSITLENEPEYFEESIKYIEKYS